MTANKTGAPRPRAPRVFNFPPGEIGVGTAASMLGVSERTIYRMIWRGDIKAGQIARRYHLSEQAIRNLATTHVATRISPQTLSA